MISKIRTQSCCRWPQQPGALYFGQDHRDLALLDIFINGEASWGLMWPRNLMPSNMPIIYPKEFLPRICGQWPRQTSSLDICLSPIPCGVVRDAGYGALREMGPGTSAESRATLSAAGVLATLVWCWPPMGKFQILYANRWPGWFKE
jgi:hypothetical protein